MKSQSKVFRDFWPAQVGIDDQDARVDTLSERARQVESGDGLAIAGACARDGQDSKAGFPAEKFHIMAERTILVGRK